MYPRAHLFKNIRFEKRYNSNMREKKLPVGAPNNLEQIEYHIKKSQKPRNELIRRKMATLMSFENLDENKPND